MPSRDFIIEEIPSIGGAPPPGGAYARFVWTARGRSIPLGAWVFGIQQATVRTDYPGGNDPTEQVLGPRFTPFTLRGRWDDRYNPLAAVPAAVAQNADGAAARAALGGYAEREWKRFEALVARGNIARITFEGITVQGIITNAEFTYRRSWDIGYQFEFSPHHRQPGGPFAVRRSPRTTLSASQLKRELDEVVQAALAYHSRAPAGRMVDTLFIDADELVTDWLDTVAAISAAISVRQLSLEGEGDNSLLRLAALFFRMSTVAGDILSLLSSTDSSEALDSELGIAALDFDVWSRGLQGEARRMIVVGQRAADELRQRARPNAQVLYRPQAGESLYAVSNRFFHTPHNWRLIARRNDLDSLVLTGDELLVIPEVTGR